MMNEKGFCTFEKQLKALFLILKSKKNEMTKDQVFSFIDSFETIFGLPIPTGFRESAFEHLNGCPNKKEMPKFKSDRNFMTQMVEYRLRSIYEFKKLELDEEKLLNCLEELNELIEPVSQYERFDAHFMSHLGKNFHGKMKAMMNTHMSGPIFPSVEISTNNTPFTTNVSGNTKNMKEEKHHQNFENDDKEEYPSRFF
eukprot:TRINITY_DN2276_c0_g2_i1.p2 TRINITY_DN2276_c0_g2~~TRINITY_DN2276_c0_g2_i1.p2  ORF type:complete len:198 (+),score=58.13 TRINITY_DN2276_c0_g2_i1:770-1363(+)